LHDEKVVPLTLHQKVEMIVKDSVLIINVDLVITTIKNQSSHLRDWVYDNDLKIWCFIDDERTVIKDEVPFDFDPFSNKNVNVMIEPS